MRDYELIYIVHPELDDTALKDLTGKIALIQRGTYDFVTKISNAEAHGAAGVIDKVDAFQNSLLKCNLE